MGIVKTILPVVSMLLLGGIFRNLGFLKREGIDNIKFLVTKVMLPVAIFHALGTADYSKKTGVIVIIIFIMLVLTFSVGFLLRPLLEKRYRRYLPYLVSVYEGGMLAYPLFTNLCGAEKEHSYSYPCLHYQHFGYSRLCNNKRLYKGRYYNLGSVYFKGGIRRTLLSFNYYNSPSSRPFGFRNLHCKYIT